MQDAGNVPRPEETRLARRGHRVKFHFKSQQGIANWTNDEAAKVVARDRESAQRDLFENIEQRNFPRWNLRVQVMPEADAARYHINPLDVTKVWPHKDYPLIDVGVLELNRNPDNYFAEVEQVAMNPANIVPGIGFSPDKMLQGRLFSYGDAPARETVFGRCMGEIAHRRKDFLHKCSTTLAQRHRAIFVGNVNASTLAQTRAAKSVLDAGWSTFRTMLQYKCDSAGVWFKEVDEAYSTQD